MKNNNQDKEGAIKNNKQLTEQKSNNDIIIHVDCDCFYAACERTRNPKLKNEPLVIGMGYDTEATHGAVATASYEAREHGIESAMPIEKALSKLPRRKSVDEESTTPTAYYKPVDIDFYESKGEKVHSVLKKNADVFESVSVDEAYLDVTNKTDWSDVKGYVTELKQTVQEEESIPVSIGVAPTKSAAKVASDYNKPNGIKIVKPTQVSKFFAEIPVDDIHGVGDVTAEKLHQLGIKTGGDLATADPAMLKDKFGTRGGEIHQRARGHDPREVTPAENPKSVSNESSLGEEGVEAHKARKRMRELCEKVGDRIKKKNAFFKTVSVKVVSPPFEVSTRSHSLTGETQSKEIIHDVTNDLLDEFKHDQVRKIGVRVSNLSFSDTKQKSLDEWDTPEDKTVAGEIASKSSNLQQRNNQNTQTHLGEYS